MLDRVKVMHQAGLFVDPADPDIAGAEQITQLVTDQIDDALEVELCGHALLDTVDQRQLGGALLELRRPLSQCRPKAFPLVCARYDQCCPPGEPRDEIALFALESAKLTLDIEIQIAEGRVGEQRSNQAGALVGRRNALRPVPKTRSQGAPRLRQPWCDRLQQFSVGLPLRQPGAGHFEARAASPAPAARVARGKVHWLHRSAADAVRRR